MGFRRLVLRWLTRDGRENPELPYRQPTPPAVPLPAPSTIGAPKLPASGLVVGQVARRGTPLALPKLYTSDPTRPVVDRALLREAWDLVSEHSDTLVVNFYAELFARLAEAPMMFPSSMVRQRKDFGRALVQWVVADDVDSLIAHLGQLGADHRKFDVEPRHYDIAGAALVSAWRRLAGAGWTDEHEAAVVASYTRLASIMIDGALAARHEPASWPAEITEHRRLMPDFAVLRVQPDSPYPYKAGQYLTLEVPSHRRQWRQMSIANAPRADNTFDVHVRSIGHLGVSAALVRHTKVGDRLRLGPPRGNDLVVEPGTVGPGLLCVGSGTGAAPISAVVESILGWPELPNQVYAFLGGRTKNDIYQVDKLQDLVHTHGSQEQVHVHAVVSEDRDFRGYRGKVEVLVPSLHDWAELGVDVLVAGPNQMIAGTVTKLAGIGVSLSKIHFDQYEVSDS